MSLRSMKTIKNGVGAAFAGLVLVAGASSAQAETYTCKHQCYMDNTSDICVSSYQRTDTGFERRDTGRLYSGEENDRYLSIASPYVDADSSFVVSVIIDKKSLDFRIAKLRTDAPNTFDTGTCTWSP